MGEYLKPQKLWQSSHNHVQAEKRGAERVVRSGEGHPETRASSLHSSEPRPSRPVIGGALRHLPSQTPAEGVGVHAI